MHNSHLLLLLIAQGCSGQPVDEAIVELISSYCERSAEQGPWLIKYKYLQFPERQDPS